MPLKVISINYLLLELDLGIFNSFALKETFQEISSQKTKKWKILLAVASPVHWKVQQIMLFKT